MSNKEMNRRDFLQATGMLGVGLVGTSALLSSCGKKSANTPLREAGTYYIPELPDKADDGKEIKVGAVSLLGIGNVDHFAVGIYRTLITDLSTAFTVEGSTVKNEGAFALAYAVNKLAVRHNCKDLGVGAIRGISGKLGSGNVFDKRLGGVIPSADVSASLTCTLFLLSHKSLEGLFINGKVAFLGNLTGKVDREAERVVKLEYLFTRNGVGVLLNSTEDQIGKDGKSGIDGCIEAFLFLGEDILDIVSLC